jgi:hypothetical protein
VHDRILPYVGFIFNDERWQWRVMFPETQISYKLGYFWYGTQWFYFRAQYNVEAYEIKLHANAAREKVELEDWRAVLGLWSDHRVFTKYVEAGWVFGRDVDFLHGTPGFHVNTGFIVRAGICY